jgi:hypothetical protein
VVRLHKPISFSRGGFLPSTSLMLSMNGVDWNSTL